MGRSALACRPNPGPKLHDRPSLEILLYKTHHKYQQAILALLKVKPYLLHGGELVVYPPIPGVGLRLRLPTEKIPVLRWVRAGDHLLQQTGRI